jgi:hypothetical protein
MPIVPESLELFIKKRFNPVDADMLLYFFEHFCDKDSFSDKEISLSFTEKQEFILLGNENRLFLPLKSRASKAWEDRIPDFRPDALYGVPAMVKKIPELFEEYGQLNLTALMEKSFPHLSSDTIVRMTGAFSQQIDNSREMKFEAGLLDLFYKRKEQDPDLHDFLDLLVIAGITSPCPRKSVRTGLSWYEISPVLFW